MKLQIARNLEYFFSLFHLNDIQITELINITTNPPCGLRIEVVDDRVILTSWLLEEPDRDLMVALSQNQPEKFYGIPQRIFTMKNTLYISGWCPENFDAYQWFKMQQRQKKFLLQLPRGG